MVMNHWAHLRAEKPKLKKQPSTSQEAACFKC